MGNVIVLSFEEPLADRWLTDDISKLKYSFSLPFGFTSLKLKRERSKSIRGRLLKRASRSSR